MTIHVEAYGFDTQNLSASAIRNAPVMILKMRLRSLCSVLKNIKSKDISKADITTYKWLMAELKLRGYSTEEYNLSLPSRRTMKDIVSQNELVLL